MAIEEIAQEPHILVLPFPAQGHINPALAFTRYLASKGLQITVILTTAASKTAKISPCTSITVDTISDGSEDNKKPESIEAYFSRFKAVVSKNLRGYLDNRISSAGGCSAKLIMYDSSMPWVLDIAHERGLLGASFFTQACGVCAIYYHLKQGTLRFPCEDDSAVVSLPALPQLVAGDLPSFAEFMDANQSVLKLLADQFLNLEEVDWIFFNTYDKLEKEVRRVVLVKVQRTRYDFTAYISFVSDSGMDGESMADQDRWANVLATANRQQEPYDQPVRDKLRRLQRMARL